MSATMADAYTFQDDASVTRAAVYADTAFTIGNTGAVASSDADDPGITLTRTGTGTYNGTFPACPKARIGCQVQSAALTVVNCVPTAIAPTSGTFTVKTTNNAGTATDPANGDVIYIFLSTQARQV